MALQTSDVMKMAQKCLILIKYLNKRFSLLSFGPELIYPISLLSACLEKQLCLEEWEGRELFCWQPKAQVSEKGTKPECISLKLLKSPKTTDISDCIILCQTGTVSQIFSGSKATFCSFVLITERISNRSNHTKLWHLILLETTKTILTLLCWMLCWAPGRYS